MRGARVDVKGIRGLVQIKLVALRKRASNFLRTPSLPSSCAIPLTWIR